MKKYAINYSRSFPDHRVAPDFRFNKELMSGPSAYFRVDIRITQYVKDGFNAAGAKHFHIWLCVFSTFALSAVGFLKHYDTDSTQTDIGKKSFPGAK